MRKNNEPPVRLDDFEYVEVTGTTNAVADTTSKFPHKVGSAPRFVIVQEGDVYIPRFGIGPNEVDVRSRLTSHPFSILLFF